MNNIFILFLVLMSVIPTFAQKIAFILPASNFQEAEIFNPIDIVKKANIAYDIIGVKRGNIEGDNGGIIQVGISLEQMKDSDYSAIVVIGGSGGPASLWNNILLKDKIINFYKNNKIVAGICAGAVAVAKSGVLSGKTATTYSDAQFKGFIQELEASNVRFIDKNTVREGKILTSNGPIGSIEFGHELVKMLK
ncbi:MAG: DJ-1/PfpI family protein [Brevinema sp.]